MKRFLSLILCVAMIATAIFSVSTVTAAEVANGTCGSDLTWTLDDAGTLTISGTGLMYNYSTNNKENEDGTITDYSAPWINYAADIKKVVIGENVNSIGENAFEACTALETVVLSAGIYAPYIPVENFELNTPYKLMAYNLNAPIYANTVSSGLKATSNPVIARDFYIEEATTLDGAPAYRIYYFHDGVKNYLYHEGTSTTGFKYTETVPLYEETTDAETGEVVQNEVSTVWTYDATNKAWLAPGSNNRFLAADQANAREDIRCYALSNMGKYSNATLAVADPAATNIPGVTAIGKYAFSDCAALANIYCRTTEEAWAKVSVQNGNDVVAAATVTCNYVEEGGSTTAPEALTLVAGSLYTVDEENSAIVVKASAKTGENLTKFMANIATDASFIQITDASGNIKTSVTRLTTGHKAQLLGADGKVAKEYTIVVLGDTDRNGRYAVSDVAGVQSAVSVVKPVKGTIDFIEVNVDGNSRLSVADAAKLQSFLSSGNW